MTPQEINISIVEACGWVRAKNTERFWIHSITQTFFHDSEMPNCTTDLNAVAKAEDTLFSQPGCGDYFEVLANVVKDDMPYRATASQRAEALLRAIGKWKE